MKAAVGDVRWVIVYSRKHVSLARTACKRRVALLTADHVQARHGDGLLDESSLLVECQATVTPDDGFIERICRLALFCRVVVVESRCGWQGKAILRGRAHHSIALFSFWRNFLFDCRTLSHRHFSNTDDEQH